MLKITVLVQWRNDDPGAPATPGGAVVGGLQIVIKMWDNFARLTALLAKVRVWFNNLTIYLDFSAIFSQIAPSKPLNQGRHWGRLFAAEGRHFDEASNVTPLSWWSVTLCLFVGLASRVVCRSVLFCKLEGITDVSSLKNLIVFC